MAQGPQTSHDRRTAASKVLPAVRDALFATVGQAVASLILIAIAGYVALGFIDWAIVRAVFTGNDGSACRVPDAGACWPFITHKMHLFLYGR